MTAGEITVDNPITEIVFSNISATINLSNEESNQITYNIDENLARFLDIRERNGKLIITSTNNRSLGRQRQITFDIGTDVLEKLDIWGDVTINGEGTFKADRFSLDIAGAASVSMKMEATDTDIDIAGAAELTLAGTTRILDIECSGAASIRANDLIADDVSVETYGTSTVAVHAEKNLDVSGAGLGKVKYWGDPQISRATAGFSSVSRGED